MEGRVSETPRRMQRWRNLVDASDSMAATGAAMHPCRRNGVGGSNPPLCNLTPLPCVEHVTEPPTRATVAFPPSNPFFAGMSDNEWTPERIEETRRLAQAVVDYVANGGPIGVFVEASAALEDHLPAKRVLSLLDALESARAEPR